MKVVEKILKYRLFRLIVCIYRAYYSPGMLDIPRFLPPYHVEGSEKIYDPRQLHSLLVTDPPEYSNCILWARQMRSKYGGMVIARYGNSGWWNHYTYTHDGITCYTYRPYDKPNPDKNYPAWWPLFAGEVKVGSINDFMEGRI